MERGGSEVITCKNKAKLGVPRSTMSACKPSPIEKNVRRGLNKDVTIKMK